MRKKYYGEYVAKTDAPTCPRCEAREPVMDKLLAACKAVLKASGVVGRGWTEAVVTTIPGLREAVAEADEK